jgi:hypothetical protein
MRLNPNALVKFVSDHILAVWLVAATCLRRSSCKVVVWGPTPIISNKHWSAALKLTGRESITLMRHFYPNNRKDDFDLYFDDLVPRWIRGRHLRQRVGPFVAARWIMRHAAVVHIPFTGGPLGDTTVWRLEARMLRRKGVRTVVMPYGGDMYLYSRLADPSLRHALLVSYPDAARQERAIQERVRYWVERANILMVGFDVDGIGRWDLPPQNFSAIDVDAWRPRTHDPNADGRRGRVIVAHAPNHRGFKGTEFVLRAIERLQQEGFAVELALFERIPNDEIRRRLPEAHILLDQLVTFGYGFAAIEAMASGLPVIVNLDDDRLLNLGYRYSTLRDCPLVSATPENVTDVLRELIRRPDLRQELGRAGRQYVDRYHSYEARARFFGAIHENLLEGGTHDLMRVFDGDVGVFPDAPPIEHPLVRNRVPVCD